MKPVLTKAMVKLPLDDKQMIAHLEKLLLLLVAQLNDLETRLKAGGL